MGFRIIAFYCLAIVSFPWLVAFLIMEKWHERHRDKEILYGKGD
jgi:hypothetical protein